MQINYNKECRPSHPDLGAITVSKQTRDVVGASIYALKDISHYLHTLFSDVQSEKNNRTVKRLELEACKSKGDEKRAVLSCLSHQKARVSRRSFYLTLH